MSATVITGLLENTENNTKLETAYDKAETSVFMDNMIFAFYEHEPSAT